jgi:hypothetical protein
MRRNKPDIEMITAAFTEAVAAHSNKNRIPSPIDLDAFRNLANRYLHGTRIARADDGGWRISV